MDFTKAKIEEYKQRYGKIRQFKAGDKSCILRNANRNDLSLANLSAITKNPDGSSNFDPHKYNESILLSTWVDGDEEIKTDDKYFLGISAELDKVIEKAQFEVVEL